MAKSIDKTLVPEIKIKQTGKRMNEEKIIGEITGKLKGDFKEFSEGGKTLTELQSKTVLKGIEDDMGIIGEISDEGKITQVLDTEKKEVAQKLGIKEEGSTFVDIIQKELDGSDLNVEALKKSMSGNLKLKALSQKEITANTKPGHVRIFPSFTGKKFIGGKFYEFKAGEEIIVPESVKKWLKEKGKLLFF